MGRSITGEKVERLMRTATAIQLSSFPSSDRERHHSTASRWIIGCIVVVALVFYVWGIQKDLPFAPEVDEAYFVPPAVRIAATGDLNPGWFGHPGSTIIYPLVPVYRIWNALAHGGRWLGPDTGIQTTFEAWPSEFYLLGRLLTVLYGVMSLPVVYLVGRRAFGERVGLIGASLTVFYPILVQYGQVVRTDTAATFFGLLGLWRCLILYDRLTPRNQVLAGLAIGLAIASRYFMVALIPVFVAVDGAILYRNYVLRLADARLRAGTNPPPPQGGQGRPPLRLDGRGRPPLRLGGWGRSPLRSSEGEGLPIWPGIGVGLLAILAAFALSTPYFFLDFSKVMADLGREAAGTYLGAVGFSRQRNFLWYVTYVIPENITWAQAALAAAGIVLAAWRHRVEQVLLAGFIVTFLVGISLSLIHWQRWVIQVLPVVALFAAAGLTAIIWRLGSRLDWKPPIERAVTIALVLLLSAVPAYELVRHDIRQSSPSTRVAAREWIVRNLPAGSRIAKDWETAPLDGTGFDSYEQYSLGIDRTLDDYYREGYRYLVISASMFSMYQAEASRYPFEVVFYKRLLAEATLLAQFEPSASRRGPTIGVYELQDQRATSTMECQVLCE
ncbi:MAG: glycosyltransferase family 39 protein [Chloroflexi bacterium]|nr:glycosyltransferase family 39 protein [Chloroflexota bacterium]